MVESNKIVFFKNKSTDKIWWVDNTNESKGLWLFSFDKKKIYNMFSDYPWKLKPDEKKIFDNENPYWKEFFKDRN